MTKLLDKALEAVRRLPPGTQDEIAETLLQIAEANGDPEPIAPEHLQSVLEGLAQVRRREFATAETVEAAFRRFDA
jgi:hypothetical protein